MSTDDPSAYDRSSPSRDSPAARRADSRICSASSVLPEGFLQLRERVFDVTDVAPGLARLSGLLDVTEAAQVLDRRLAEPRLAGFAEGLGDCMVARERALEKR